MNVTNDKHYNLDFRIIRHSIFFILFIFLSSAFADQNKNEQRVQADTNLKIITSIILQTTPRENINIKGNTITIFNTAPKKIMQITVDNSNVTITGTVASNEIATDLITKIASLNNVNNLDIYKLSTPDGLRISRAAIMIGFTQGYWIREGLFEGKNAGPMPRMFVSQNIPFSLDILYIDGTVNSLDILSRAITIALHVAQKILPPPPMRVISRMKIRGATYGA